MDHVRAAEKWLDDMRTDDLRRIGNADIALTSAVVAARANGRSWADIALMLGTSRRAVEQRYG